MDDPWGSPWASLDPTSKHDSTTPSPPKDLLSPPPRAFFGSTSSPQSQSPWTDNNGFGGWAGADATDITSNTLGWGVWAEPSARSPQPSPRPDESRHRDSIAISGSAPTPPGLTPLPRSRASSVFRHHSPDPWASETSLHDRKDDSSVTSWNGLGISDASVRRISIDTPILASQNEDEGAIETPDVRIDKIPFKEGNRSQTREPSTPRESHDSELESAQKVEAHDVASRPSSTFSLDSPNRLERQDSPITSIDEDPRSRLQTTSRKLSGKVQELVGMYDSIAKTATEEPSPSTLLEPSRNESRGRSPSQNRSAGVEDDGDFGDFEDAKSESDKLASDINDSSDSSDSSEKYSTPTAKFEGDSILHGTEEPDTYENVALTTATASVQQIVEKFGHIQFDIDFQPLDKLFPDLTQDVDDMTKEVSEIPDRIIEDNFTAISERKTWYRISRFGSMRKHDSGDEDNYHRVEWSTSHLRLDTIKIVRRWMEEDSISGRATLGAGNRTSVFNWDSSAAPVDLGKVFARKLSSTHLRNASMPLPGHSSGQPARSLGSGSETRRSLRSPIQPPGATSGERASAAPSFGWNTDTSRSQTISHPSNDSGKRESAVSISHPAPENIKLQTKAEPVVQIPAQPDHIEATLEDEDDDWGEMVSSPQAEAHPQIARMIQPADTADIDSAKISLNQSGPGVKNNKAIQDSDSTPKASISVPQISQPPKRTPSQTGSSTTKESRVDPWPLADLSVFESLSTPAPNPQKQDPWSLTDFSVLEPPISKSVATKIDPLKAKSNLNSKSRENNNVQGKAEKVAQATAPLKAVLGPTHKLDHERNQEKIIKSIVQNLPDLSYMLR